MMEVGAWKQLFGIKNLKVLPSINHVNQIPLYENKLPIQYFCITKQAKHVLMAPLFSPIHQYKAINRRRIKNVNSNGTELFMSFYGIKTVLYRHFCRKLCGAIFSCLRAEIFVDKCEYYIAQKERSAFGSTALKIGSKYALVPTLVTECLS